MQTLSKRKDIAYCGIFFVFMAEPVRIRTKRRRIMEVFLEVIVQHKKYYPGFMEKIRQQPEVTSCYHVSGEYDFLVKADVTSEKDLDRLERSVRKINGVYGVQSVYALQEII